MLFVSLLAPKGKGVEAIDYLRKVKAPKNVTVHATYLTLGRYDGLILFEAPEVKTAMNFVMAIGFATDYTVETLTAIPAAQM